jgi:tetratricopeptide (TPR) repeat protein
LTHDAEWAAAEVRTTLASTASLAPEVKCALTRYLLELTLEAPDGRPDGDELEAAMGEFDHDGPIWWMAGIAARRSDLLELSADLFKTATAMAPLLAQAWAAQGASLWELGDIQDAERSLRTAVTVDDRAASAWADLAGVQSHQKHWDDAIASLNRAIETGALSFETLYNRAVCRINAGETALGLTDLQDVVARYPNHSKRAQAEALANDLRAPKSGDYILGDEL